MAKPLRIGIYGNDEDGYSWSATHAGKTMARSFYLFKTVARCEAAVRRFQERMTVIRLEYSYDWQRKIQQPSSIIYSTSSIKALRLAARHRPASRARRPR